MCKYAKLLNRYIDNELAQGKKEFMDTHILSCPTCGQEMNLLNSLRQNIVKNKITSEPEFFWSRLKDRIRQEEKTENLSESFVFDFGRWSRKLIPVPILASILIIIFLNLNRNSYTNPVDEYLFTNQNSNVLALIDDAGQQSEPGLLLYYPPASPRSIRRGLGRDNSQTALRPTLYVCSPAAKRRFHKVSIHLGGEK